MKNVYFSLPGINPLHHSRLSLMGPLWLRSIPPELFRSDTRQVAEGRAHGIRPPAAVLLAARGLKQEPSKPPEPAAP